MKEILSDQGNTQGKAASGSYLSRKDYEEEWCISLRPCTAEKKFLPRQRNAIL